MHFIIGLFLLCVILAVPALRAVAFILLLFGGLAIGALMLAVQHQGAQVHARCVAATNPYADLIPGCEGTQNSGPIYHGQ